MAWVNRHEPWIDWRSKTVGETRHVPSGAFANHEPTTASKQKRYWRDPLTESVSVLNINMSELVDSDDFNNISCEIRSLTVCESAHIPSGDIRLTTSH